MSDHAADAGVDATQRESVGEQAALGRADLGLNIAHVLFTDIVGYSKLLSDEQRELFQLFNEIIRNTRQFRAAEAAGKLVRLATGDGIALAFFTTPDAPVRCAREISCKLREHPQLQLRMGINSGPVDEVSDVNDRRNVTGAGINIAQRVMDCGDAGHILLSKRVADDLAQYSEWQPQLHDLGEVEVKHGMRVEVANLYGEGFGNPALPDKIRRANRERVKAAVIARKSKRRRIVVAASATLLLLLSVAIGSWAWHRRAALASAYKAGAAGILDKSIAVLPFDNFEDKENAYFADGVQDDILTDLAKVADLKVISRRSVAQYRGSTQDVRAIGTALQVAHVLEGTVRKMGDKLRVTAQLIDTRSEAQTWAEKYDRDIADIFTVQSEISQSIITQLKAALSPGEKAAIEQVPTKDVVAYDLYLRARQLVYNTEIVEEYKPNLNKAIDLLHQATARDPSFALAYCLLAIAHVDLFRTFDINAGRPLHDSAELEQARSALEIASRIQPDLGETHLAQGFYFYHGLRDDIRALAEFAVAESKLPNNAEVLTRSGMLKRRFAHWGEAVHDLQKAAALDPHDATPAIELAQTYHLLRNEAEADRTIDHALTLMPQRSDQLRTMKANLALERGDSKGCRTLLQSVHPEYQQGGFIAYLNARLAFWDRDYKQAGSILDGLATSGPVKSWVLRDQAFLARARGDAAKSKAAFEVARSSAQEELRMRPEDPMTLIWLAVWDAGLREKERAVVESNKALELRPMARDALDAQFIAARQAMIYAWVGERDLALEQLSRLVKTLAEPCLGELKFSPVWDDLRHDPRFDKIIVEAAKPVKID